MEIRYFLRRLEEYQNEIAMLKEENRKLRLENEKLKEELKTEHMQQVSKEE